MTDEQFKKLLAKHTEVQSEATGLYYGILKELDNRGIDIELDCINNTEPHEFKENILKYLGLK